jgi:formylglycine-generating enzyme required for sulfatase activity/tRNA A-37 threonylcarbamoyl transferase component Bud32
MELQPGTLILNGKYRIERLLGEGASAKVYLATQTRLQSLRALKILRKGAPGVDTARISDYRARFELEGRLQDQLGGSPGIVRVFDTDDFDGAPVLVMEYMPGGSLRAEINAAKGRLMVWQRIAEVLREVAAGLEALHVKRFVHRDVKPSNVLLDADGRAKIGDLGVAQTDLTRTRTDGQVFEHPGTPGYSSPEHANGAAYLTPAADVYALGVMSFEMLTGRLPQPAAAGQVAPTITGDVADWLKALVQRMLAWDYRERPQNGAAVAEEIARGLMAEHEREATIASHAKEIRTQVEEALRAGDLMRADAGIEELLRLVPGDSEALRLERRMGMAIVAETRRIAADEAQRKATLEAQHRADEETQRLAAEIAEQKRLAAEAARLKREEERQRLAAVTASEATNKSAANRRLRLLSNDRAALVLAPGEEIELVRVPAGEFLMGSDKKSDSMAFDAELPLSRLALPEYWIQRTPVTVSQFSAYLTAIGRQLNVEQAAINKAHHPVVGVEWDECVAYCEWARQLTGFGFSLPSEAEWEKAARGTDGRVFPWGNEMPDAWRCAFGNSEKGTSTVGRFGARGKSPYGCDDMAGNVWEWTRSLHAAYPYLPTDGRETASSRGPRALRGGSFGSPARHVRCAFRGGSYPSIRSNLAGFRVLISGGFPAVSHKL